VTLAESVATRYTPPPENPSRRPDMYREERETLEQLKNKLEELRGYL
jgi:hypothetical protein